MLSETVHMPGLYGWQLSIPPITHMFFNSGLQDWIQWNMEHKPGIQKLAPWSWTSVFGRVCWLIWCNRCRKSFGDNFDPARTVIQRLFFQLFEDVDSDHYRHRIFNLLERVNSKWEPPPQDYIRVDVDGAVNDMKQASGGGVARDMRGEWLGGFQHVQHLGFAMYVHLC